MKNFITPEQKQKIIDYKANKLPSLADTLSAIDGISNLSEAKIFLKRIVKAFYYYVRLQGKE